MRLAPALAVLVSGLALYLSRAVLDQILTTDGLVRAALLPPVQALGAFVGLAALGLLWLDRQTIPRGTATAVRPSLGPLLLPAFGLLVLGLPYLPFLPDALPALQLIAGPVRGVIWLAVVTQLLWVFWQVRLLRADWLQHWTLRRATLVIGLLTTVVSGSAAARLTGTVLFPAGDEPHYLIVAQSVWRDRDLKIENNHARRDYSEYFAPDLDPHFLTRGADGEIYSIHPVGMPLLIAPVYAAGGYRAVVGFFVLMAAAAAALMWHAVVRATNAIGAATFAWAAIAVTTPFLYNSFAVYPEIPAALTVVIALTLTFGGAGPRAPLTRWLLVGTACAALPWLNTKYAPMSAALMAIAVGRILWPTVDSLRSTVSGVRPPVSRLRSPASGLRPPDDRPSDRSTIAPRTGTSALPHPATAAPAVAAVLAPYLTSLAGWFSFFNAIWGSPWPQAPYGDLVQTHPRNLFFGAPGLIFDQEYGLLPYAPVYIFAATGLWIMWRAGGEQRRRALEITIVFTALVATVGAFRIWWGGTASPGRPLISGLLLLAFPIAIAFRDAPAGSARRAAQHLVLWLSIGIAAIMLLARDGFLLLNDRDGTSALLEYISPRWAVWTLAPSFTFHEAPTALMHSVAWLMAAGTAAFAISRARASRPGAASLRAIVTCFTALTVGAVVLSGLPASPPWPQIDVRARPRSLLLDEFDARARPIGIEYAPLRVVSAADLTTRATLGVEPGFHMEPQSIRVLHNGRFSLPAGRYRVEVEWGGSRSGETIGLQLGRTGEAWGTWNVEPRPDERWATEFVMPIDISFVGLRGTPELERVTRRISIVPLSIVDRAQRPRVPPVLGASQSAAASIFYYDGNAFPEEAGFWVRGSRTTRASINRASSAGPLVLKMHSGLIANRLHVSTGAWRRTIPLQRERPEQIEVPSDDRAFVTLELSADDTFIPRDVVATSRDPRPLGVWIEVVK